jgi:hypothetical protein
MIKLRDKETGASLGQISNDDLQFLIDNLEEEWDGDTDYYLNRTTIEMLKDSGADKSLIKLLEGALGDRDDVEIAWEEI